MGLLEGKRAVVTGARKGIGNATVIAFAREGADVWACARSFNEEFENFCASASEKNGVRIIPVYFDLQNKDEMLQGIKQIKRDAASITTLVNCAGIVTPNASFAMTSRDAFLKAIDVNFIKQVEFTQLALRIMEDNGSVVNISSIAAAGGMPGQYPYACSKGAVETWTIMLAQELGSRGIRVNAAAPGFVDTDMGNAAEDELLTRVLESTIMKRMARPGEIANTIAALASDMCSFITGQVLYIDGGRAR